MLKIYLSWSEVFGRCFLGFRVLDERYYITCLFLLKHKRNCIIFLAYILGQCCCGSAVVIHPSWVIDITVCFIGSNVPSLNVQESSHLSHFVSILSPRLHNFICYVVHRMSPCKSWNSRLTYVMVNWLFVCVMAVAKMQVFILSMETTHVTRNPALLL